MNGLCTHIFSCWRTTLDNIERRGIDVIPRYTDRIKRILCRSICYSGSSIVASFAKKKRNFTTHRFEALLYLSWKNTKNTRNAKNIIIKNYIFVKFPSKFPIHSRKLSLEKREKKLEILYTLNWDKVLIMKNLIV